jgi:predicted Zn-dependent protease
VLVATTLLATVCAEPSAMAATAKPAKAAIARTCRRIAEVLSDGPDPVADPVGYAEAQVRPLREIKTSDAKLKRAIDQLASAYERVYKTNAAKGTGAAVETADKAVDLVCPGAA